MSLSKSLTDVLLVALTTFLITWLPITSQVFIFRPWFDIEYRPPSVYAFDPSIGRYTAKEADWSEYLWSDKLWTWRYIWLFVFDVVIFMIWANYALCVFQKPGHPPAAWTPPALEADKKETLAEMVASTSPSMLRNERYCAICEAYKPPRAHHCRQCNMCILKMDHHCPWVGQCVGFRNQGHFVRFLVYAQLGTVMCLFTVVSFLSSMVRGPSVTFGWRAYKWRIGLTILNCMMCLPVMLGLGALAAYHLYYVACNMTTIESFEKDKALRLLKRKRIMSANFPFDVSVLYNMKSVLGPVPILWWAPQPMFGDGLGFQRTNDDPWPPLEPGECGHTYPELETEIDVGPRPERNVFQPPTYRQLPPGYGNPRVRRGSEGYEVRMMDNSEREALVRAIMEGDSDDQGDASESDNGSAGDDDDVPLAELRKTTGTVKGTDSALVHEASGETSIVSERRPFLTGSSFV